MLRLFLVSQRWFGYKTGRSVNDGEGTRYLQVQCFPQTVPAIAERLAPRGHWFFAWRERIFSAIFEVRGASKLTKDNWSCGT
jgi:hypothetical protein